MHRYDGGKSYEENQRVENDEGKCAALWDGVAREDLSTVLSDVRKEAMESVGKVEGTVRTKSWGRDGIYSVADTLVTYPINTLVPLWWLSEPKFCYLQPKAS